MMTMNNGIVVVGSCMIDLVSYAPKLPRAGETVLGTKFITGFGGKGANQCVAAAKLGGKTTFVARLGDDAWGHDYLKSLKELKVDTTYVQITPGCTSGVAPITVDESGQNQIVVISGANGRLNESDVASAAKAVSQAAVLVCQLETSINVALEAIRLCKGISILNGAPAIANCDTRLLTSPTIFCVNETEAAVFTGLPVDSVSEAKIAIAELLTRGCNTVILTLGAQGALLASKEQSEPVHVSAPKVTNVVDTTGAGDSFIGALAYLIAEFPKISLENQVGIACEIAAISVTKLGTQISFPTNEVLQKILKQRKLK
ncbi:uncharacterized protein CBL_13419 [Carabus blaptoides fortunei]